MPLSWNEIKDRALNFSKEWEKVSSERAEAKSFWDDFFNVFGVSRRRLASFETPVKKEDGRGGYIDLLWKGMLLVEHKSRGKDLSSAYQQAKNYFSGIKESDLPRYVIVSNFNQFRLYDLDINQQYEFELSELHKHIDLFGFIAGYQPNVNILEEQADIEAAVHLGKLHEQFNKIGYKGHDLEIYLVRLLYCLFADDTGIFLPHQFKNYIMDRTAEDGSDLSGHIGSIFQTLNTPTDKRLKNLDKQIADFPYVDGGLFEKEISLASFDKKMRQLLLDCCSLDWSLINPSIFGSLFQSAMEETDRSLRRSLGAHYTTEENILKVIRPLFLDDLWNEFNQIKKSRHKLIEFHLRLTSLKFLDPACGSGNFLATTYKHLRLIELEILKEIHKNSEISSGNLSDMVLLDVDQFYGIEIEEFPAKIAEASLWMTDHQMNILFGKEFGTNFVRLPLKKSPKIVCGNALRINWSDIVDPKQLSYILSNPPFIGKQFRNAIQKKEMDDIFNNSKAKGVLDYVSAWYVCAAQLTQKYPHIKVAYVSTNSITQGEQAGTLWSELRQKYGVHINFAYRSFKWFNEAQGRAAVHCVIIGFSHFHNTNKVIFENDETETEPYAISASRINPYLVDAENIFILNRKHPISDVPEMSFGNMPNDDGNLLLSNEDKLALLKSEPLSKKWIRPFIGANEFINGINKWCLWLENITPHELKLLPNISKRVVAVKRYRETSKRSGTRKLAQFPTLFGERRQPTENYILMPRVSSEKRLYIPIGFFSSDIIVGDTCLCIPNATLYHFGILNSQMHMAWVRVVCGRLKSDYRYSCSLVYNNYPWPNPSDKQQNTIEKAAQLILNVRMKFPDSSLADLYNPLLMPPELINAHKKLDYVVDIAYGKLDFNNESERVAFLIDKYNQYCTGNKQVLKEHTAVEKRVILSSLIVKTLSKSKGFGRTKFSKVFYVADMLCKQDLNTKYYREAAGPIDYDFLYGKKDKIDILAAKGGYFTTEKVGSRFRYLLGNNISSIDEKTKSIFGDDSSSLKNIIQLFEKLNMEQSEIIATLFACWNDFLVEGVNVTDKKIIDEMRNNWHVKKQRFSGQRLQHALKWMRKSALIPIGKNCHTLPKKNLKSNKYF